MRLNLNVLEHLGINLYSNVPSVLAEVVANSWDADATIVDIKFDVDNDSIVIQDDGEGMNFKDVNGRFLTVGYRRRDKQPGKTNRKRSPMGRKGIGKLSLFSIAQRIKVETSKDGELNAFEMSIEEIRKKISETTDRYNPRSIPTSNIDLQCGTRITLSGLKKNITSSTVEGLRKRLARRFSIIGSNYDFTVRINGIAISPSDRGYFDKLQCLWTYGAETVKEDCANLIWSENRSLFAKEPEIALNGWLGTVTHSNQLKDELGDNLNRIAIFVRGKLAQEDILGDFSERGVYASYLIGELHVEDFDKYDGLNSDKDDDAATSSRQRIVEDDPRYEKIKKFMRRELKYIQKTWAEQRSKEGTKNALEIPAIKDWINKLTKDKKKQAARWLGKINQIKFDDEVERRQLWKHAIIAFEFYSWGNNLNKLENIDEHNIEVAIDLFNELDSLEFNLYGQIVKERVEIIRTLKSKVEANSFEKAIQEYIFDHLWLLDPAWERVDGSEVMETGVESVVERISETLTNAERRSRVDIAYRKTAGKHVIIEMKRPNVKVGVDELSAQISKYRRSLSKLLMEKNIKSSAIEIVCILGTPPREWELFTERQRIEDLLKVNNARFITYDNLLDSAFEAYTDYSKKQKRVDRLSQIVNEIDDYAPRINGNSKENHSKIDS